MVITDYLAIKSITNTLKEGKQSNWLNNWALFLSKYTDRMMIKYQEGRSHWNADGLSCLQVIESTKAGAWTIDIISIDPILRSLIIRNLRTDRYLRSIYNNIVKQIKQIPDLDIELKMTKYNFRVNLTTKLLYMINRNSYS